MEEWKKQFERNDRYIKIIVGVQVVGLILQLGLLAYSLCVVLASK